MWVSGHSSMTGNETPDRLAKQASNLSPGGPEPFIGISRKMVGKMYVLEQKRTSTLCPGKSKHLYTLSSGK